MTAEVVAAAIRRLRVVEGTPLALTLARMVEAYILARGPVEVDGEAWGLDHGIVVRTPSEVTP